MDYSPDQLTTHAELNMTELLLAAATDCLSHARDSLAADDKRQVIRHVLSTTAALEKALRLLT